MDPHSYMPFNDNLLASGAFDCSHCKKLLSPPVMLIQNKGNVCHTCYDTIKSENLGVALENTSLDILLAKMYFYCYNNIEGCDEIYTLEEYYLKHKNVCQYKQVECAFNYCLWRDTKSKLMEHINTSHDIEVLTGKNNEFVVPINKQNFLVRVLKSTLGTFICKVQCDSDKLYITVCAWPDVTEKKYQLVVYETKDQAVEIRESNVVEDIESLINFDKEKAVSLKLSSEIIETINIAVTKVTDNFTEDNAWNMNLALLNLLRCQFCKNYLRPPIHQCEKGHDICMDCRSGVEACPKCKNIYKNTRNFSAEYATQFIRYPCKNSACTIQSLLSASHENICQYQKLMCPIPWCKHLDVSSNLLGHMLSKHSRITNTGKTKEFSVQSLGRKCKYVLYMIAFEQLFQITFIVAHEDRFSRRFTWEVSMVGSKCSKYSYSFELGIFVDQESQTEAVKVKIPCVNRDNTKSSCVYLEEVFLSQFIDLKRPFCFKMNILKDTFS